MVISPTLQRGVSSDWNAASPVGTTPFPVTQIHNARRNRFRSCGEAPQILLKVAFAVMLLLRINVSLHGLNLRRADAECAIAFLP